MVTITLKGREIPLIYTVYEMKQIQEEIGDLSSVLYRVTGRDPKDENNTDPYGGVDHLESLAKLIRILGNAGLEETGEAPDLTEKKIMRAIKPNELILMANECLNCMTDGMLSEIPETPQEGPVDVTLEEMEKKKETEP